MLALVCAASCAKKQEPATPDDGVTETPETVGGVVSIEFDAIEKPPMAFFESFCARCHGPHGSFYGEAFASINSDRTLHGVVVEMIEGPGFAESDERSTYALVAMHRSLRDGTPFGIVTEWSEHAMAGEMVPGTVVSVVAGTDVLETEMGESSWRLASDADLTRARVRVMRNGRVFEWDPSEQPWSDAPPPTHEE